MAEIFLKKIRMPFRDNSAFGIVFLTVLCVPLFFTIYTPENFETVKFSLWLALSGALAATLIFSKSSRRILAKKTPAWWFFLFLMGFVFWAAVSLFFSPDKLNSLIGFYYRFNNSLLFYGIWGLLIGYLLFFAEEKHYLALLKLFVFDGAVVALLGVLETRGFAYYEGLDMPGIARAPSLLGNPIFSSMFVAMALPLAVYFWSDAKKFTAKIYYGLASFLMFACILALASRGAWLALAASLIFIFGCALMYSKKRKILVYGFLGLILTAGLTFGFWKVYSQQSGRMTFSLSETNISTRLYAWEMAKQAIIYSPWFGTGLGNFQQFFEQNRYKYLSNAVGNFDDPHNLFLQLAATGGVPLLVCFLTLLFLPFWRGLAIYKQTNSRFVLALLGSLVAFSVAAAFTPVAISCFLFLAVILAPLVLSNQEPSFSSEFSRPLWLKIFGIVFGGVLIYSGLALITAEHFFYQAEINYNLRDYQKSEKFSAWAAYLNPTNSKYFLYEAASRIMLGEDKNKTEMLEKKLLGLHPKEAITYSTASALDFFSYLTTGRHDYLDSAAELMKQSLVIDSYDASRYVRLGYYYLYGGDIDSAREMTKTGLSFKNDYLLGWIQLAKIYQIENKKPQFLYALDNAFKSRPDFLELSALLKEAKQTDDISKIAVPLPAEQGSLN